MLSITKSKLAGILDQPSDIPTDITFLVYDEEDIFHALKYYLALVSEVLKTRFFGSFEALIHHVYHKNCELEKKSVEELFEVANIAEMYDVAGLMTEVGVAIARVPVTVSNVVDLAHTAEQFSMPGEQLCQLPCRHPSSSCFGLLRAHFLFSASRHCRKAAQEDLRNPPCWL